jgi:hypothetical protein
VSLSHQSRNNFLLCPKPHKNDMRYFSAAPNAKLTTYVGEQQEMFYFSIIINYYDL